jgi:hypothetical protein
VRKTTVRRLYVILEGGKAGEISFTKYRPLGDCLYAYANLATRLETLCVHVKEEQ